MRGSVRGVLRMDWEWMMDVGRGAGWMGSVRGGAGWVARVLGMSGMSSGCAWEMLGMSGGVGGMGVRRCWGVSWGRGVRWVGDDGGEKMVRGWVGEDGGGKTVRG